MKRLEGLWDNTRRTIRDSAVSLRETLEAGDKRLAEAFANYLKDHPRVDKAMEKAVVMTLSKGIPLVYGAGSMYLGGLIGQCSGKLASFLSGSEYDAKSCFCAGTAAAAVYALPKAIKLYKFFDRNIKQAKKLEELQ